MTKEELIEHLTRIYKTLKTVREELYADNVGADLHLQGDLHPFFLRFDLTATKFFVCDLEAAELHTFLTGRAGEGINPGVLNDLMKTLKLGEYAQEKPERQKPMLRVVKDE